jgi:membrane protein DedA with SNARE-associated domain
MTIESQIDSYGFLAILVGTFLEGETVLILGGLAAYQGYLGLPWVILAAFIGSLCGDQLFFFLGRRRSQWILAKRPSWQRRIDRAQKLLERFRTPLILVFRFLYGLRTVAPFVIGMSSVSAIKFVLLNAVGAMVWAIAVGTCGYLFGNALEALLGNIKHYEHEAFLTIAVIGAFIWVAYFYHRRKRRISSMKTRIAP